MRSTEDVLKDLYTYDPQTGQIFLGSGTKGWVNKNGYTYITTPLGKKFLAHRLAWLLYYGSWPEGNIDHINRDKSDNRIDNLRDVTQSENLLNHGNPFSGIYKHRKKWRVRVGRTGECGSYYCFGKALKARNKKVLDSYTLIPAQPPKEPKTPERTEDEF